MIPFYVHEVFTTLYEIVITMYIVSGTFEYERKQTN